MHQHDRNPALLRRTDNVGLAERTAKCLTDAGIVHIGDLVQMTESELLRLPHVGRGSLHEIKMMLAGLRLHLGMVLPDWPPKNWGDE
jgi:DNA-directed RNA polymerase subunit alpha